MTQFDDDKPTDFSAMIRAKTRNRTLFELIMGRSVSGWVRRAVAVGIFLAMAALLIVAMDCVNLYYPGSRFFHRHMPAPQWCEL